jgi:AcrR family transcriptional regulator
MPPRPAADRLNPRKTPAQQRSEVTVDAILEAAARILETRGFGGYTTNAVAARAGVSIGSLYQYFPGKDALTKALIRRETTLLLADAGDLEREEDGRSGLRRLIRAAVGHQLRRPTLARLLDLEEIRLPIRDEVERVGEAVRIALERLLTRPDLPPSDDAPLAARDLLAIVKGMVDAAGVQGETDVSSLEARVNRAVFGYIGHVARLEPGL